MTLLLEATRLGKSHDGHAVLKDVSLSVHQGQVICILGEAKSGKSTLLRTLNLIDYIDQGTIDYGGYRVIEGRADAGRRWPWRRPYRVSVNESRYRRNFGVVHRSHNLYPTRTILQNVMEGPVYVQRQRRRDVEPFAVQLLHCVRLAEHLTAYPEDLSREQKQRAALARALAMKPDILLLDEMTTALDPPQVAGLLEIIKDLRSIHNAAMVIATNHVRFARRVADEICFMDAGRIILKGPPQQALGDPMPERFRSFLDSVAATA